MIKYDGHSRTRRKCRKHELQARAFYISRAFLIVLVPYDIEVMWQKTIKRAFSMFYTLITHGFLTNQSARMVLSILHQPAARVFFISFVFSNARRVLSQCTSLFVKYDGILYTLALYTI